jgi:ferredoxin--NADP+ reductase
MYRILEAGDVGPGVRKVIVAAPHVATHYHAGQFVIVRVDGTGERIPLTVAAADRTEGTITLFVQGVGKTTKQLNSLTSGQDLHDVAGPLGKPSEIDLYGTAVVVGGGVGTAIAYPVVRALVETGNRVIAVVGGRTRDFVILETELKESGAEVIVCTDDGSYGRPGFVTEALAETLSIEPVDVVFAAGPVPMMRAVAETTRPAGITTIASLNPIMVDGTGMCGGCRVEVGGETKFACVDGPEFDAHLVDFDLLARRNQAYVDFERKRDAELEEQACRIGIGR